MPPTSILILSTMPFKSSPSMDFQKIRTMRPGIMHLNSVKEIGIEENTKEYTEVCWCRVLGSYRNGVLSQSKAGIICPSRLAEGPGCVPFKTLIFSMR